MAKPNRAMSNLSKRPALGEIKVRGPRHGEQLVEVFKAAGGKAVMRSRRFGPRSNPIINWNVHVFALGSLTVGELNQHSEELGFTAVGASIWDSWVLWQSRFDEQ